MKTFISSFFALLALLPAVFAEDKVETDWAGKTVLIKISKEGSTCVKIDTYAPVVGQPDKSNPDVAAFKVLAGSAPGTVAFESVSIPGMYLRHSSYQLVLAKKINDDALFRIVPPVRGNLGISLRSFNFPTHHIALLDKEHLGIVKNIKEPKNAIFYLQERK
jgi:hypothetical protein